MLCSCYGSLYKYIYSYMSEYKTRSLIIKSNGIKVNKSVYMVKSGKLYDKNLNNFLLHVPNRALKDMHMLDYGTINNMYSLYSSIKVLIDFINSAANHMYRYNCQGNTLFLSINFVRTKRLKLVLEYFEAENLKKRALNLTTILLSFIKKGVEAQNISN